MNVLNRLLIPLMIIIIALVFLIPKLSSGLSNDLLLLYSQKGSLKELSSGNGGTLAAINYVFQVDLLLEIFAKIVAALSLVGLFYQLNREKNLEEAQFITEFNNSFISNPNFRRIYAILEESKEQEQSGNPFEYEGKEVKIDLANYLSFFEPIYSLRKRKLISFKTVDQLAYRFFLATNNRYVQEMLICEGGKKDAWENIYRLHQLWKEYRKNNVWQEEHDLSKDKDYDKIIAGTYVPSEDKQEDPAQTNVRND